MGDIMADACPFCGGQDFADDGNFGFICLTCGAHFDCPDYVDDDW